MSIQLFPIRLANAYMLSPRVKHFVFQTTQEPPFNYQAGQFITLHFDREGKKIHRSYSIANAPQQNNCIEFAAGYVEGGPGTELLFNLQKGDVIHINGPFGRLVLKEPPPKRYILVATSTGVTPYRAMLEELKKQMQTSPHLEVIILQGVQHREDILYREEFIQLTQAFPQVAFRVHLSREKTISSENYEFSGHVQTSFPLLALNPVNDLVYLCGNPGMIDESFTYLKDKGFTTQQVIREKYLSR